jgi:hypothetical protein
MNIITSAVTVELQATLLLLWLLLPLLLLLLLVVQLYMVLMMWGFACAYMVSATHTHMSCVHKRLEDIHSCTM